MNFREFQRIQTRRSFLEQCAGGLGTIALWHLMEREGRTAVSVDSLPEVNLLRPKATHFVPKAKNVIFLFMEGGPSQLDLFDPKPGLGKYDGQSLPASMTKDLKLAFIKPDAKVWSSPRVFTRHGRCGMEFSDYLPFTADCADDVCMIRSMVTDQFNHHPGQLMMTSGTSLLGRPSMGAWVTYGLGSESQNLPGFVALTSGGGSPGAGSGNWANGFLPSVYQGVPFRNSGDPVLHLSNIPGIDAEDQRMTLDAIRDLNQQNFIRAGDIEIASRIASYELAFRMQSAAPELLDFSKESPSTLEMYGVNKEPTHPFATNCLLARRMIERGVRFIQLMHPTWDDHSDLNKKLMKNCTITDQPTAALLKDLKQRGLLESTLVIWGSEFGRTPLIQTLGIAGESWGRDHHPNAFTMWMAGGGIKSGQVVGKTDDLGFNVVEDRVHVHDLHATILHCLGLDHKRLTYRHMGRDFRLTDVEGEVVSKLLA
jgi:hypothetical protein